jgi:predicted nucleic acid-binding protein
VTAYADSSAVVPLYVTEQFSEAADTVLRPLGQVPFTLIHQLEIQHAFERLVGSGLISREQAREVYRQLQDDVDDRRLTPVSIDLERVFLHAVELSGQYAAKHLARSLDLLHVAAAHVLSCTTFVSGDNRQLRVAKASGLKVIDIKRRRRRRR